MVQAYDHPWQAAHDLNQLVSPVARKAYSGRGTATLGRYVVIYVSLVTDGGSVQQL